MQGFSPDLIGFSFFVHNQHVPDTSDFDRVQIYYRFLLGATLTVFSDQLYNKGTPTLTLALKMWFSGIRNSFMANDNRDSELLKECKSIQQQIYDALKTMNIDTSTTDAFLGAINKHCPQTGMPADTTMILMKQKQVMANLKSFIHNNSASQLDDFFKTPLEYQWATVNLTTISEAKHVLSTESANPPQAGHH